MVLKVRNLPGPDEMAMVEEGPFSFPGGSTANVAVGLSRLGAQVRFIGKVGGDAEGRLIIDAFSEENVDTSFVRVEPSGRTSRTIIAVDPKGARIIFSLGGTALLDTPEEFDAKMLEGAKILYIGEARPDVAKAAARTAKDMGIISVYAPGGVFSCLGTDALEGVLVASDYLILNRRELYNMTKTRRQEEAIEILLARGAKRVLVTLGHGGASLFTVPEGAYPKAGTNSVNTGFMEWHQPAFKTDVVDTTGAGDAFAAGFIRGLLDGLGPDRSLKMGCACGALAVTALGPREALPSLQTVLDFLRQQGEEKSSCSTTPGC
ncbi:MAG TPA: carbohydrate kinase family protein [Clostridia bacterium]|nr:carbohydrate kinase family protein [Clostridia bacterium]